MGRSIATLATLLIAACTTVDPRATGHPPSDPAMLGARLDAAIPALIETHKVAGVGIAVIEDGRLAWTGYYGDRAPGAPITAETMFNTASVAKTVTAETVLRLADAGLLPLDEPIAAHWQEKDLASNPRYRALTPRIILSHRSGLLNWSYAYEDGKLAFVSDPGARLTYSGAAYEMLVHFVEAKLGRDFESLAREHVYEPMGLQLISLSRQPWIDTHITHSMDAEGTFHAPHTYPGTRWVKPVGYLDGADDLYVSVADYARFLLGVMDGHGLDDALAAERFDVVADARRVPGWACVVVPATRCPDPYGYALGWTVFGYPDRTYIQHGGTDFGEHAMVYFVPETREGLVIFVNGGNGPAVALDILDLIDPDHPLSAHFRARLAHSRKADADS